MQADFINRILAEAAARCGTSPPCVDSGEYVEGPQVHNFIPAGGFLAKLGKFITKSPSPSLDNATARSTVVTILAGLAVFHPIPAAAHVKWFEAYEVAAAPVPISTILMLPYFWLGIAIVLLFFAVTTMIEQRAAGALATRGLDQAIKPLHDFADTFMIAVLAAFFVALFAVGGSYLTPELKTESELVP